MSKFRDPEFRNRIDTRPQSDPHVAAGMRNIHRDMSGKVIGATTAEGENVGSKYRTGTSATQSGPSLAPLSATPRLDAGVQTPRLDINPSEPMRYNTPASRAAEQDTARSNVALNGGFGIAAQERATNLQGRRSLFQDMQSAGQGGISPDMEQRAKGLGVPQSSFRRVAGNMTVAPASIAAATPAKSASPSIQSPLNTAARPVKATTAAVTPLSGAAKANADIAKYGVTGASQRTLAESATAKKEQGRSKWRNATATASHAPMAPLPAKPLPQSVGLPANPANSPLAKSLTGPAISNPQRIGDSPIVAAKPAAPQPSIPSFEELTQPRNVTSAVTPKKAPPETTAPATPARPTTQSGPYFTTAEARVKRAREKRDEEGSKYRKEKKLAYDKVWNEIPDMGFVDRNSIANKTYKSVRAYATGHSY